MKSEELADDVKRVAIIADAQARILGVGREQYTEGDEQQFETMPLQDLIEYAREEALDLINYGVMLTLRIERLAALVGIAEDRADQ